MQAVSTYKTFVPPYISLAFFVVLACIGLGYIDHETKSLSQLAEPGNIMALLIYFVPTYFVCGLFHSYVFKKQSPRKNLLYSLLCGVPVGFTVVILGFVFLSSRQ